MKETHVLEVKNLQVGFKNKKKFIPVVDGVSFSVKKGETLCIVGESGCGKSLTSLAIMGLLPQLGKINKGQIIFDNEDLTGKNQKQMSNIRGNKIAMIFQEPMTSLNPVHTVGRQVSESIRWHQKLSKKESIEKATEMLRMVGIPSPDQRVHNYPHELSGGMRQRVMTAMALSCNPKLLIADEPTTALDVTIQAQILDLMDDLKEELDMSTIMITHDLGVVSEVADRVLVMYAGKVVEYGNVKTLFNDPKHPYTQGLIESIPKLKQDQEELPIIKGSVPRPENMPMGCRFSNRCPFVQKVCLRESPPLIDVEDQYRVSCWMYTDQWENMKEEETKNASSKESESKASSIRS